MNRSLRPGPANDLIAVVLGNKIEASRLRPILGSIRTIAKKLVIVFSDGSIEAFGDGVLSQEVYLKLGGSPPVDWKAALRHGVEEALRLSKQADQYLIITCQSSKPPSVDKIQKMAASGSDFSESSDCMVLSRHYAEFIARSGNMPSLVDAHVNGFISSMSLFQMILSPKEAIKSNWTIVKFGTVGASGLFVYLTLLTLLKSFIHIFLADAAAVEVSILNNFAWNDLFTFKHRNEPAINGSAGILPRSLSRLFKYNMVSLTSLGINLAVFSTLYSLKFNYIVSSLVAVAAAFSINYLGSSNWAWRKIRAIESQTTLNN